MHCHIKFKYSMQLHSWFEVREEEMNELDQLLVHDCHLPVKGGTEEVAGKANCLMQVHPPHSPLPV